MNNGGRPRIDLRTRLLSRTVIDPSGCVLYTGARDRDGYGVILSGGGALYGARQLRVHRVMYEWFAGPIPAGTTIDHLCRVRNCVNVSHLEAVAPRINIQRGYAARPPHTHCRRGHAFDKLNTGWHPDGKRYCRACQYASTARSRLRKREA